ncbi:hypothetical protein [Roseospira visakhapatnamensis]|uniref:Uncharacterized protein n=1 Tax=Roseospira visakhapatnamensis TaxID=390880 RepID=A0A7W6W9D3_9PROT|nr:hypothetical protein [Roseospira visakhapatnamensis]MBB4266000.1 hypothetical protein [Roseospira visakhapatnamensis]
MSRNAWNNLAALFLTVIVALVLSVPVFDAMERGQRLVDLGLSSPRDRLHPDGLGPLSGLMMFVLAAPLLIAVARSLTQKLGVVLLAAGAALTLSRITTLFEQGHMTMAWTLVGVVVAAVMAAVGVDRLEARRRRHRVEALTRRVVAVIDEAAVALGAADDAGGDRTSEPSRRAAAAHVAQSLALGVVWQARIGGRPEVFEREVRQGLADIRRDLARNRILDPDGVGRELIDHVRRRLGDLFETPDPDAPGSGTPDPGTQAPPIPVPPIPAPSGPVSRPGGSVAASSLSPPSRGRRSHGSHAARSGLV